MPHCLQGALTGALFGLSPHLAYLINSVLIAFLSALSLTLLAQYLFAVTGRARLLGALETLLLRVSALAERRPDIRELDLNPVLAYPDRVVAVDARALIEEAA